MIHDKLDNLGAYLPAETAEKVLNFIKTCTPSTEEKEYPIIGDKLLIRCFSGETKPRTANSLFEAHRKYVDIQCLISGREIIDHHPVGFMREAIAYDAAKEYSMHEMSGGQYSSVVMEPGVFAVFGPQDAHRPMMSAGSGPEPVKKIVVKADVSLIYRSHSVK
jgi:YhcH/YjgK/YiaL family protein